MWYILPYISVFKETKKAGEEERGSLPPSFSQELNTLLQFHLRLEKGIEIMSSKDSKEGEGITSEQILEELQKIRTLLTPPPPPSAAKEFVPEFLAFLKKYQVLGLAVAFVMAIYLGALVKALVADLIMPVVGLALGASGGGIIQTYYISIFGIGDFLIALITFIIVALVIFGVVKVATKWKID
jgi:large conductance mechanosensitive channel